MFFMYIPFSEILIVHFIKSLFKSNVVLEILDPIKEQPI